MNYLTRWLIKSKKIQRIIRHNRVGFEIDHYSDKYWNNLDLVQRYICKNCTGDENTIWQVDILSRFKERIPFSECLVIGCGNGWVERQLYDLGVGKHFDAFDISDKYLQEAKKQCGNRNIDYFREDINHLSSLGIEKYDAVFNVGVLHHTFRLTHAIWNLAKALKSNGLLFNFDYIGPAHNQYSDEHVSIMNEINSKLPDRFKSSHKMRPDIMNFYVGDISEAVHSDLIRPTISRFFDIIYERDLNGGIAYQILWNNIDEFKRGDDDAKTSLTWLLKMDEEYTVNHKVPVLFWYSIGKPKLKSNINNFEILP